MSLGGSFGGGQHCSVLAQNPCCWERGPTKHPHLTVLGHCSGLGGAFSNEFHVNRGCTRHPTLPVPLEPRHGGDTRFWGGVGKAVTPCSLVWLGRHWGGCEHPCPCLCPPVEAASAEGWGHHFRGETVQVGDTISGVREDRLGTPFQECYGTGQTRHRFRDATGHDSLGTLFQGAVPMLQG